MVGRRCPRRHRRYLITLIRWPTIGTRLAEQLGPIEPEALQHWTVAGWHSAQALGSNAVVFNRPRRGSRDNQHSTLLATDSKRLSATRPPDKHGRSATGGLEANSWKCFDLVID